MEININATDPLHEQISSPKKLVDLCRFSLTKIISSYNSQNFDLACITSYKMYSLLTSLGFVLPLYPTFGAITSFANAWLGALQTAKQQLEFERCFALSPFTTTDALFDPLYDFKQDFLSVPGEILDQISERVVTDIVWELRRVLMKQKKAGKVSVDKMTVLYEIDGFRGTLAWDADHVSDDQNVQNGQNVNDAIKIVFTPLPAIPEEPWLKTFADSVNVSISDRTGQNGYIFTEIRERIYQSVIRKQIAKISSINPPGSISDEVFVFTAPNGLHEDQIKLKLDVVVYGICFKFQRQHKSLLADFIRENSGIFASESQNLPNLIHMKKIPTGEKLIQMQQLKSSVGATDYLIFLFTQNFDYPWSLQSGKYKISYQEEQFFPENVMMNIASEVQSVMRNEFLTQLNEFLPKNQSFTVIQNNQTRGELSINFNQTQLNIKDKSTFSLIDLITGDNSISLINSIINGGFISNQCFKEDLNIQKLIEFALNDFQQLNKVLQIIQFADQVIQNLPEDVIFRVFYEKFIGPNLDNYNGCYFYEDENEKMKAVILQNQAGDAIVREFCVDFDQNQLGTVYCSLEENYVELRQIFNKYEQFQIGKFLIQEKEDSKVFLLVQDSQEIIEISIIFESNELNKSSIVYKGKYNLVDLQCSLKLINALAQNYQVQLEMLQKRAQCVYFSFNAINSPSNQQIQDNFDTRFYSPYNLVDYLNNFNQKQWIPIALNKDVLLQNIQNLSTFNDYYQAFALLNRDSKQNVLLTSSLQIHLPSQKIQIKLHDSIEIESLVQERRLFVQNKVINFSEYIKKIKQNPLEFLTQQDEVLLFMDFYNPKIICKAQISSKFEFLAYAIKKQIQILLNKPKTSSEILKNQLIQIEELTRYSTYEDKQESPLQCPTYAFSCPQTFNFFSENLQQSIQNCLQFQSARQLGLQILLIKSQASIRSVSSFLHSISKSSSATEICSSKCNIFETFNSQVELIHNISQTSVFLRENCFLFNNILRIQTKFKFKDKKPIFCMINTELKEPEADTKSKRFNMTSMNGIQFAIDLGGCKECIFKLQFDSPSVVVDLIESFKHNNEEVLLNKQIIRQYSQSYFFSYNSELIKFFSFKYFIESAESHYCCGEKQVRCPNREKSSQQDVKIIHWQNQCRCGGHHVSPFGHRSVALPIYKNSKQYIQDVQKSICTANLLNILNQQVEIFGSRKLANQERDYTLNDARPEVGANCVYLTLQGCDGLKIQNGIRFKDEEICVWDLGKKIVGVDGVVFGVRFYAWNGEVFYLDERKWLKSE